MEGQSMACHALGTINSLADKITQMMKSHPKMEVLLQQLEILRKDYMNKFVSGRATTGEQVKLWMKQVREMVYDIEDWVDTRQEAANLGELNEMKINEFKGQIQEALERCRRYELLNQAPNSADCARSSSDVSVIDRPLLWEKKFLVGISGPKSKLLNHLEINKQEELKVVSILGTGGHGKTTLAKEIYGDIKAQFECHAFVCVGRTTSPTTTLVEILRQVKSEADTREASSCNVKQVNEVSTELWGLLRTKRYFICIDDIRCPWASKVVNCALPDNNLGSRILTTTRMKNIAASCSRNPRDVVYEMNTLGEDDSKSLLVNSMYVRQVEWPDHFNESSEKLLELCGGTPLAIIIAAGLLSGKTSAELSAQSKMLEETMLAEAQAMKKILDICYSDLSLSLKSCFLYLSAFSGNHINKGHLIRRWAAEGLITERHGKSLWETGESYFNELIIRRLIQPEFDDYDNQPIGCTVDGTVFDFIESRSAEENFITVGAELKAGLFPCDRVRRVCLDCSGEDEGNTSSASQFLEQNGWVTSSSDNDEASNLSDDDDETSNLASHDDETSNLSSHDDQACNLERHLSSVRSFAFYGDSRKMPCLAALKLVRVLDLKDTKGLTYHQLKSIELLFLLRYLGLGGTNVTNLPQQIMALKHLITLDLRRTEVRDLQAFEDNRLVYLLTPGLMIPSGIGVMRELEELSEVFLGRDVLLNRDSHADSVAEFVNKSRRLRKLGVKFGYVAESERQGVKYFLEKVEKSNLQSLSLDDYPCDSVALLAECWTDKRPRNLRKFELRICGCFPVVPAEMASIKALTHLHIQVKAIEAQGVRALGNLPNLILLKVFSEKATQERLSISSEDGFQSLKVFCFRSSYFHGMGLQFIEGAMPHLHRLQIEFNARKTKVFYHNYDFGIQHLCRLLQVCAIIRCKNATDSEAKAAEADIRDQVSRIPYNPLPMQGDDLFPWKEATREAENSITSTVDIKISILPESSSLLPLPVTDTVHEVYSGLLNDEDPLMDPVQKDYSALMFNYEGIADNKETEIDPDVQAVEKLREIITAEDEPVVVEMKNLELEPHLIPEKFIMNGSFDLLVKDSWALPASAGGVGYWKKHGREVGWGVQSHDAFRGLIGFKRTFVFHRNNTKTDWIMNIYALIEGFQLNATKFLCKVFQNNLYDPRPLHPSPTVTEAPDADNWSSSSSPSLPSYPSSFQGAFTAHAQPLNPHLFGGTAVDPAQQVAANTHGLLKFHGSPMDTDCFSPLFPPSLAVDLAQVKDQMEALAEFTFEATGDENCDQNAAASGKKRKSEVWSNFTEIYASNPAGEVLTLLICDRCGMAYNKESCGTGTLGKHKCPPTNNQPGGTTAGC